jgi:hypothetical protein
MADSPPFESKPPIYAVVDNNDIFIPEDPFLTNKGSVA